MVEITTISVSPENADALRSVRDERELKSMDEALAELLKAQAEPLKTNGRAT